MRVDEDIGKVKLKGGLRLFTWCPVRLMLLEKAQNGTSEEGLKLPGAFGLPQVSNIGNLIQKRKFLYWSIPAWKLSRLFMYANNCFEEGCATLA